MNKKVPLKNNLVIGMMFFALFLGAGNVIFPPMLGQMAGQNLGVAMLGFLITGVGLPFLAIIATARNGDLQELSSRIHPVFGLVFSIIIYTMLGPFFGIPRTATVSYEIGIVPFLSESTSGAQWPLTVFSIIFFGITIALSLNPKKIVDVVGKILTPVLLLVIGFLAFKSFITPMGELGEPQGPYGTNAFSESFIQGYLTMDVLAALIIGILIINVYRDEGVTDRKEITRSMMIAGGVVAIGLSLVYMALSYIGATSLNAVGLQENGGAILALSSTALYGQLGAYILAVTIILACLTTSIGLVLSISQYFNKILPKISYQSFVWFFGIAGALVANVGLTNLIAIALPVLMTIYPLAILLVLLSFIDKFFNRNPIVYISTFLVTFSITIFDGLGVMGISIAPIQNLLSHLPFSTYSLGWVVPSIIGLAIGLILHFTLRKSVADTPEVAKEIVK